MSRENYDVFISYRRSDAVNEARSINDRLRLRQIRCFYDFDELKDRKFDEKILDAIKDAEIFITILSPDYFCRCSEKDDWVRKEIECAIANHKKIVPINVNNHFDRTKHIPENVPYNLSSGIIGDQFSEVYTGTTFNDNIDAIIRDRIQSEIPNIGTAPSNSAKIEISSDADCRVLKGGKEISQVQAKSYNFIYLGPGNHRLVFQSVKYEDIEHKEIYCVRKEELPYEDFIEVELLPLIEKQEEAERKQREEARLAEEERKRNEITKRSGTVSGHDYVDLGLSVKWATCNVGANAPHGYGNYYAWGETSTKNGYYEDNSRTFRKSMSDISGNASYDAARANWGGTWRLPTKKEMEELVDKCTWQWITQSGIEGYKVTGPNGNSIFLPAAGFCNGSSYNYVGEYGYYWNSMPDWSSGAHILCFYSGYHRVNWCDRYYGNTVRPVSE